MGIKPGQVLNDLVHVLERALTPDYATIEKNRRIRAIGTGQNREFDVLITWKQAHHTILTAIECRDRSRPVGVPEIEAFAKKCERCGIGHRIIVSSTGFTNTARNESSLLSVILIDIDEVLEVEWHNMQFFAEFVRYFDGFHSTIFLDEPTDLEEPFTIYDTDGNEVSADILQKTLVNAYHEANLGGNFDDETDKHIKINIRAKTINWKIVRADGSEIGISHIDADGGFTLRKKLRPLRTYKYGPKESQSEVAIADAELNDFIGKLALTKHEDGQISVRFISVVPQAGEIGN